MKENLLLLTSQVIGHTEVSETLLKFSESESESEWESESESESESQSESESVCVCVCVCVSSSILPWMTMLEACYTEHSTMNTNEIHIFFINITVFS